MTPAQQETTLDRITNAVQVLRGRLPLVDDYWVDLEDIADSLEALVEATE